MGVFENGVMGKTQQLVNLSFGDGLHSLFIVILGMLHYWVCHIISKELLSKKGNMMEYDYHPFLILDHVFWQTQVAIANHWLGI